MDQEQIDQEQIDQKGVTIEIEPGAKPPATPAHCHWGYWVADVDWEALKS
jgi:hypothetical protein